MTFIAELEDMGRTGYLAPLVGAGVLVVTYVAFTAGVFWLAWWARPGRRPGENTD